MLLPTVVVRMTRAPAPSDSVTPTPPGVRAPEAEARPIERSSMVVVTRSTVDSERVLVTLKSAETVPKPSTVRFPSAMVTSWRNRPSLNATRRSGVVNPVFTVRSTARPNVLTSTVAVADIANPAKPRIAAEPVAYNAYPGSGAITPGSVETASEISKPKPASSIINPASAWPITASIFAAPISR